MFGRNKKNRVIFLKSLGEKNYQKIDEKGYNPKEDSISYKDKTFPLTSKCYTYIDGNKHYIFADYEKEEIIKFNKNGIGIDAKFLDKFLTTGKRGIIGQLMSTLKADMDKKFDWITTIKPIIWAVIGLVIGYLVGSGGYV